MSPDLHRVLLDYLSDVRRVGYLTAARAEQALAQMIAADDRFADFHPLQLAQHVITARISRQPLDLDSLRVQTVPAD